MEREKDREPTDKQRQAAWRRIESRARAAGDSLREIVSREVVQDLRTALDVPTTVRRHPYISLAAALGAGYLLGGGLFAPVTRGLIGSGFRLGLRLAALPFVKGQVERLLNGDADEPPSGSGNNDRPKRAS